MVKARLLFTNTNSLCYEIETYEICENLKQYKEIFDFSDCDTSNKLSSDTNEKVIGKMKDELNRSLPENSSV